MAGLRWARVTFGKVVRDAHSIFVVPTKDGGWAAVEYVLLVFVIAVVASVFVYGLLGRAVKPLFDVAGNLLK
jgi:Flp pilus assembly pilin Flp